MEKLINELEKEQGQIWKIIQKKNLWLAQEYIDGWNDAFDKVISIIKENKELRG